ncbi:MAG: endonuclease [Pseudomonadota bacterium]
MSRGICLVVCWGVAAAIAVGAGYLAGGVAGIPVLIASVISLFVFLGMAWALPAIVCESARVYDFEYSEEAKAAYAASAAKTAHPAPAAEAAAQPATKAAPASAPAPASGDAHWSGGVDAASGAASAGRGQTDLKPSAALSEEATLRAGVGDWKYSAPEAEKPAKKKAKSAAKEAPAAAEPDGGAKPATLDAARDGKADDLKKIKGVGPKMEKLLNSLGFYHFDQIAAWSATEVAWVDDNLEGFKGRVSRDDWVAQAQLLATGGDTEFSKKVDKGDVY